MNILVVGAGFTGATAARYLADKGHKVKIIDKRSHIGGNAYDEFNENGVLVHEYGPHVFFTDNQLVWNFISKFSSWIEYKPNANALIDNKFLSMPFNFNAFKALFSNEEMDELLNRLKLMYKDQRNVFILDMIDSDDELIKNAALKLYEKDYLPYNMKQWGLKPENIDFSVTARIPIRLSEESHLKDSKYQYMPKNGYTALFKDLLNHGNITIELGIEFKGLNNLDNVQAVLYTGMVDRLFDYKYGELPYRTIEFKKDKSKDKFELPSIVVYYPSLECEYTRKTDYSYLPNNLDKSSNVIITETPKQYIHDNELPYYVVLTDESKRLYNKYLTDIKSLKKLFVAGRLADFKYYNMDNAIERGLEIAEEIDGYINGKRRDYYDKRP